MESISRQMCTKWHITEAVRQARRNFLNAVHPKYAVISCGEGNSYGHPHAEVLNRLRSMGVEVFRTDEQGSIIASSDGENINWNCSATDSWQSGEQTESDRENAANVTEQTTYVLNTNTKKIPPGDLRQRITDQRGKFSKSTDEP